MNLFAKQNETYRLRKQTYGCQGEGMGGGAGIVREFGMDMLTLLYLKWITNKDLAQGTLLTIMWQPGWEESLVENRYIYMRG